MSSLWNRSGTIERYADDIKAAGAKAYFYQGGTTTPLTVFQDSGEAAAHPNPVVADANGRWPDVFVPYVTGYDVRVLSAFDVQLSYSLQIPNPDPVEVTVVIDPLEKVQTGMCHFEFVNTTRAGFVRLNGKTIGNAASSATERANADTSALFVHLWDNLSDAAAPVSGGRGGSAASDFAANKTLTLPNLRGAMPLGLDDMGNTAGGYFAGLTFLIGSAILAGSTIGTNALALIIANLPAHGHTGTTDGESAHTHTGTTDTENAPHTHSGTTGGGSAHFHDAFINDPQHTHSVSPGGPNVITAAVSAGQGAAGANHALGTIQLASTGVRVKSTSGGAADDRTANESAHTHPFTSGNPSVTHTHTFTTGAGSSHVHTFTSANTGSGTPINNLPRSVLVTWFIKL